MFVLKPTLSKVYLTFILSFPFSFPVLLYIFSGGIWFVSLLSAELIGACIVSVFMAYVIALLLEPLYKHMRFWQPTLPQTILAIFLELLLFAALYFLLQSDTGHQYLEMYFSSPSGTLGVDPCPALNNQYDEFMLCRFDFQKYEFYLMNFSLINACISQLGATLGTGWGKWKYRNSFKECLKLLACAGLV